MPLIEYDTNEKGSIVLPEGAPFDGKPVLIKLAAGWCEAYWEDATWHETPNGREADGFCWVCMDGDFQADLDDALGWLPLPEIPLAGGDNEHGGTKMMTGGFGPAYADRKPDDEPFVMPTIVKPGAFFTHIRRRIRRSVMASTEVRRRLRSYDPACYDLAAYFLSGDPAEAALNTEENRDELAHLIQRTVEDHIEYDLKRRADGPGERA